MSDNLSDDLIARGLKSVNALELHLRLGRHAGRPDQEGSAVVLRVVSRVGQRAAGRQQVLQPDAGHTPFYTPDLSRPAFAKEWYESKALRADAGGHRRRTSSTSSPIPSGTAIARR